MAASDPATSGRKMVSKHLMPLTAADGQRRWQHLALGALGMLLSAWPAVAQDVQDREVARAQAAHAARMTANPPGLSLTIVPHRGTRRFAQGELITLDLEFRDDSGAGHLFDAIAYDRSGRLGIDRIVVTPAAAVEDPLRDYYRAMGFGLIGGGLSTPPAPLDGPRRFSLDLNEWVRFARPGVYAVYVESHRFSDGQASGSARRVPLAVVSNLLALEVTAPPAWRPPPTALSARALRFADSPQAARELARRLLMIEGDVNRVGTEGHDIRFGLLGTPFRTEALVVLREGLATASRAVNDAVPEVTAFLDVMTAMPHSDSDGSRAAVAASAARARADRYGCQLSFWRQQALAAGLRGGPEDIARATVAFTDDPPPHCSPAPRPHLARVLPPVFDRLRPAQQQLMLSYRWGHVAGAAMLPVLRRLVSAAVEPEIRDAALVRLGELAPQEAARVSLEDVISGRFSFSAQALRLGRADRGVVTHALARQLERAREQSTSLSDLEDGHGATARGLLPTTARYATRATCAALADWPGHQPPSCAAQASVVACALAADRRRGARVLRQMLGDPRSRCGDDLPDTVARGWPQHVPEGALLEALWHDRPRVVASAARALARIGSADARAALWRRLEAWRARWAGREHELQPRATAVDDPVSQELALEHALRGGLLHGRGWLTTAEDRRRLRDLCVTAACREEYSPLPGDPPMRLVLVQAEEWTGQTVYQCDGHAFYAVSDVIDRLALYPKTVTVAWQAGRGHAPARAAALYKALANAAANRGLTVLAQPPRVSP